MIWNKYSLKLFLLLGILSLIGFGFFWSINFSQLFITKIVFFIGFLLVFIALYKYINRTNKDLDQFLEAIQYLDNIPSLKNSDLSRDRLHLTYTKIIDKLKEAWLAKESEHQYFRFVLEHVGIGIISFDKTGKVEVYNITAKEIFGIENLGNILNLNKLKENLGDELFGLKSGKTKLLKFNGLLESYKIIVKSTEIKIENKELTLISLQNIKTQLEESELEAWQKLIRVLTHEIMNSVTPIKSLTYSMQKVLIAEKDKACDANNMLKGLKAIENRSKGLLNFVESYKNLTQIPKPNYETIRVDDLIQSIRILFEEELQKNCINFKLSVKPQDLSIIADGKLISQVLINLLKNSISALENTNQKNIELSSVLTESKQVCLSVVDNGKGIPSENLDKIFIPFYTTRENGSGIGLSFARQVMVLHNGSIDVQSNVNGKTKFSLYF